MISFYRYISIKGGNDTAINYFIFTFANSCLSLSSRSSSTTSKVCTEIRPLAARFGRDMPFDLLLCLNDVLLT